MRALTAASLGLCVFGLACTIRPSADVGASPPPGTIGAGPLAGGPGGDPCAVYIERSAPGVRCQAIDEARCTCELVAAASGTGGAAAPVGDADPSSAGGAQPAPPAESAVANLEFAKGPQNTIVQCVSGPCPTRSADFITSAYPPIPLPAGGATIQLEFRAKDYKPYVGTYDLVPGRNFIQFTLEREFGAPSSARFQFEGAPPGTTVECVSGPCVDNKAYAIDKFPEIPLKDDDVTLLLRFNAPGYRTAMTSFQVRRGPNAVPVLMEKAPLGK
jgi:hypothetical protein